LAGRSAWLYKVIGRADSAAVRIEELASRRKDCHGM